MHVCMIINIQNMLRKINAQENYVPYYCYTQIRINFVCKIFVRNNFCVTIFSFIYQACTIYLLYRSIVLLYNLCKIFVILCKTNIFNNDELR